MGGMSSERKISLKSGQAVAGALRSRGHDVVEIDVTPNLAFDLREAKIDVAWIALHGAFGEDGCVDLQTRYNGIQTLIFTVLLDVSLDFLGDFYERFLVIWKILDIALGSHLLEEVALLEVSCSLVESIEILLDLYLEDLAKGGVHVIWSSVPEPLVNLPVIFESAHQGDLVDLGIGVS